MNELGQFVKKKQRFHFYCNEAHSRVKHAWVCELYEEVFVLKNP